ncbi:hypothetical protein Trydic_g10798 [Trypoxylus dichotomus]
MVNFDSRFIHGQRQPFQTDRDASREKDARSLVYQPKKSVAYMKYGMHESWLSSYSGRINMPSVPSPAPAARENEFHFDVHLQYFKTATTVGRLVTACKSYRLF